MNAKRKILAICGSTRKSSSNRELINAIIDLYASRAEIQIFENLDKIPHFNPDLDNDNPPEQVTLFRNHLTYAEGVLICTPEYAMGVPGTLKNAIDWTVSSMEFSHKPVALITASSQGFKAHASLMETLKVIESNIPGASQLVISFVKTKVKDNRILHTTTLNQVQQVMESLFNSIEKAETISGH
jgi:chromate reductase